MTQTAEELGLAADTAQNQDDNGVAQPELQADTGANTDQIIAPASDPWPEKFRGKSDEEKAQAYKELERLHRLKTDLQQINAEEPVQQPLQQQVNPVEELIGKTTMDAAQRKLRKYEVTTINDEGYEVKSKPFAAGGFNPNDPEHLRIWNECYLDAQDELAPTAELTRRTYAENEQFRLQQQAPTIVRNMVSEILKNPVLSESVTAEQMLSNFSPESLVNLLKNPPESTRLALETLAYAQLGRNMVAGATRVSSQNPNVTIRDAAPGNGTAPDPKLAAAIKEISKEYAGYGLSEKDIIELAQDKVRVK